MPPPGRKQQGTYKYLVCVWEVSYTLVALQAPPFLAPAVAR